MPLKKSKNNTLIFFVFGFILLLGSMGSYFLVWRENSVCPQSGTKIGLLNGDRLWTQLPMIIHLKEDLHKNLTIHQKKFSRLEAELRKENQELIEAQRALISNSKSHRTNLEQRQKVFSAKVMNLQKNAEDTQKKINSLYEQSMIVIKEKINLSIQKIARQKNLSLVLYENQVAYHKAALNITDDVFRDLKDFQYPPLKW
ncbi:MAG: hypothetical protein A2977_00235 [Alphaproteobacteria bacterium RIFCSPLOWO2_01_FULL_45_8]|nr:MAG: hypothetical protein A2065_00655 [Alphaproteobacteria bacterium GWB1_45_5]OFW76707.1 MAG: hypothetical protein A3K20_00830 [Alphaproteobacteria bacterium GWA1_45_9]OFW89787.1 MAG: hypothetical protein A2621_02720 [Alphaproteobacteria bacterium RIFCSPHIGHO2_01_FULL_41_14]OFW96485.1 MAG: hypothetical protein A2977_00235 [Alphaproteobacteria bacterium RIFCSPLOWO2_01_FULL_45_8]HCI48916.1 hypothetical protein [Holosporales bacterium]HLB59873.1 OmpH family outer membrane protein [Bdellovibri